jgi:hypothetical protein
MQNECISMLNYLFKNGLINILYKILDFFHVHYLNSLTPTIPNTMTLSAQEIAHYIETPRILNSCIVNYHCVLEVSVAQGLTQWPYYGLAYFTIKFTIKYQLKQ